MRSEDNTFPGEEAREALQTICDKLGFTLVESIEFEKRNGKCVSVRFDVRVNKNEYTLRSTLNEHTDYEVLSHSKLVNIDDKLFSRNAIERVEAERDYLASSCRKVLVKMLGHKVSEFGFNTLEHEIPDASSVEELKLKLELMA